MKKLFRVPSPALVISLIALFVALGGTSYAAITRLPVNSVGTAQIKNNAVTGKKLAKSITLAPGHTEKGVFGFGAYGVSDVFGQISFPTPLTSTPNVIIIPNGDPTPEGCTGTLQHPGADAGNLCVFEGFAEGGLNLSGGGEWDPTSGEHVGFGLGIVLWAAGGGSGYNDISGTWAVTA
jgi:hypothetical protein